MSSTHDGAGNETRAPLARVKRIVRCPPFDDFRWSDDLEDLKRFVVVYGPNGSGKTTLSEIIAASDGGTLPHEGAKAELTIRDLSGGLTDLEVPSDGSRLSIRTYSTGRINDHLGTIDRGELPVNLVLGKGQAKAQADLEREKESLRSIKEQLRAEEQNLEKTKKEQDKRAISVARELKVALASVPGYMNYKKTNIWSIWRSVSEKPARTESETLAAALGRAKEAAGRDLPHLRLADDLAILAKGVNEIREPPPEVNLTPVEHKWLVEGVHLHNGRRNNCLYCENPVSTQRHAILQELINDQASEYRSRLEALVARVETARASVLQLKPPDSSEIRQGARDRFVDAVQSFKVAQDSFTKRIDSVANLLNNLLEGQKEEVGGLEDAIKSLTEAMANINAALDYHNKIVEQHANEVETAAKEYEKAVALNAWLDLERERTEENLASKKVEALKSDLEEAEAKVVELEAARLTPEISATELTRDLAAYFGRNEIEVRTDPDNPKMYQLLRNQKPATRLSDGERRAISFVYFLETLRAHNIDRASTLVVIDDPVNSMDEQSIYHAQHFMRDRTRDIGQTIVLTHNFPLFRLLRRDALNRKKGDSSLLMLTASGSPRQASLHPLHPFLRNFDSDYHYLFFQIWRTAQEKGKNLDESAVERHLVIPNQARRLLEAFGSFLFPGNEDTSAGATIDAIIDKVRDDGNRPVVEASKSGGAIKAFLNQGSHQVGIGTHDPDPVTLVDCPSRMHELLILMKHVAPNHVSGLEKKCRKISKVH